MSNVEQKKISHAVRFLISAASGVCAVTFVQPFDLVKSRMQISGIGGKTHYANSWHCIRIVVANEGFLGLYQGLGAAWLRQLMYTGTRLATYTYLNDAYKETLMREPTVFHNMAMGIFAGGIGAFVATPTDVALIRMTTDMQLPPGERRHYANAIDALLRIAKEEGELNMWRGCFPTVIRAMVMSMSQLASYSYFRGYFKRTYHLPEGLKLQTFASMVSGLITTIVSLPVDIAKTRIQNQKIIDGKPEYKGTFDVLRKLLRNEGAKALWKGFTPYFLRVGPQTVLLFFFLEQQNRLYMKYVLGIEGKGSGF